jgi:hypothetical protein
MKPTLNFLENTAITAIPRINSPMNDYVSLTTLTIYLDRRVTCAFNTKAKNQRPNPPA